ncbi:hypothetical protein, partial [uncultured Sutterella sp.]|uniref:hypothetical protein n=1 Tax=uncultured Sutterella sp. TaxID=286133 RepID=UPI002611D6A1
LSAKWKNWLSEFMEAPFSSAANKTKSCVAPQTQESDVVGPASLQIGCIEKRLTTEKGTSSAFFIFIFRSCRPESAPLPRLGPGSREPEGSRI